MISTRPLRVSLSNQGDAPPGPRALETCCQPGVVDITVAILESSEPSGR